MKEAPRIPRKKGQPAGSDKHSDLYTDENPKGTIHGLGFKDVKTAEASVKKIENSGKTHAHKIQAAIAMEQRARVMGKTAEAAVYRKYIEKMKKITKQKQQKESVTFRTFMEKTESVVFTFGRFNPPTTGHEKLIEKVRKIAGGDDYYIFPSHSQNPKKDPLPFSKKVAYMRDMFPKHKRNIVANNKLKTALDIAVYFHEQGYKELNMVVGSDRVAEFQKLLKTYNGQEKRHGFYDFDNIQVFSAGDRDPDAEGVTGMSASKMRLAASQNNFKEFVKGLPKGYRNGEKLFKDVRQGMGLKETSKFSEEEVERDLYVRGVLYRIGDLVENTVDGTSGEVVRRGPNYVQYYDGENFYKAFLNTIREKKEKEAPKKTKQDPDIKDREGTQPAKYYDMPGKDNELAKSTKQARARHFAKGTKMDDDNPDAYKPAPGDKDAKTKPSKHTLKYKKMFGESLWANIHKKRQRIKQGSGEKMRKVGDKGAPTPAQMKRAQGEENIEEMPYYRKIYDKIHQMTHPKGYEKIMKMYVDLHKQGHKNPAQALGQMIRGVEARDVAFYINGLIKKGKLPSKLAAKVDFEIDESFQLDEKIAGLVKKSEKSGIAYGILKKVYDRGMAAWRTGHRPGTTPQQWGFARVNSFVTKSKGTWGGADKDLASKARGSKKESYDIGVDYAKHTFSTTPGQKYEQTFKSKKASEQNIKDWFERKSTREEYQNRYKENWKERLKETYNRMLEKVSCDDCNNKYIENDTLGEAEYQGKKVKLNDPFRLPSGSNKKFGVYVKNEKGNIIKVTFGDPNMEIKRDDPGRRKSFRARHNCDNPGPKTKARYWSCFQWRKGAKVDN
tara:strand:+ start:479 stop:2995 length:2517 start_codon:yes stop_codon:yes gene_type:complete